MVFLLKPSMMFGAFTVVIYLILSKAPKRIRYALPIALTLPAMYIPLSSAINRAISENRFEILPIAGFLAVFIAFVTPASSVVVILMPLIDKLRKKEFIIILCLDIEHLLHNDYRLCRSDGCRQTRM